MLKPGPEYTKRGIIEYFLKNLRDRNHVYLTWFTIRE